MRFFFLFLILMMGAVTLWSGTHHLMAALVKRVGDQAVQLALVGRPLTQQGAERVVESRTRALAWLDHRRNHVEIGIAELNRAIQLPPNSPERAARLQAATGAIEASLRLSPVQPVAWLLLSQIAADEGDWDAAAERLSLSLETGHFIAKDARLRSALGLLNWFNLNEATIERLMPSIVYTVEREPRLIARLASDQAIEDEIAGRLVAQPESGAVLWRQFAKALHEETGLVLRPTVAQR